MENRDQRAGAVSNLVKILRKITRIVQIAPFAYLLLLAAYLLGESFMPDWALRICDNLLDVPVYTAVGFLFVGRLLKLCSWFRTACLLPFTTRAESYVDSFVYTFTQNEIVLINVSISLAIIAFIILSIRHFTNNGRKADPLRNP